MWYPDDRYSSTTTTHSVTALSLYITLFTYTTFTLNYRHLSYTVVYNIIMHEYVGEMYVYVGETHKAASVMTMTSTTAANSN